MGACLTFDDEERKARMRSELLDRYLQQCAKDNRNVVKILLLGKNVTLNYSFFYVILTKPFLCLSFD